LRVFGFAGWSGSGKTTLIEQLIPRLVARGTRLALVKHAHHAFDVDQPGKDSHRHRSAGATEVLVTSSQRWALMHELRGAPELTLAQAIARLSPCDLVLVEGYKRTAGLPKLEIHRGSVGKPWLHPDDPWIVAIAADVEPPAAAGRPWLRLDDLDGIAALVSQRGRPVADWLTTPGPEA
jgi:molybdopterin-guanine dinucleotide biosynthesis protein B